MPGVHQLPRNLPLLPGFRLVAPASEFSLLLVPLPFFEQCFSRARRTYKRRAGLLGNNRVIWGKGVVCAAFAAGKAAAAACWPTVLRHVIPTSPCAADTGQVESKRAGHLTRPASSLPQPPPPSPLLQPTCTRVCGGASGVNARVCARTSGGKRTHFDCFRHRPASSASLPRPPPPLPPVSLRARVGMRWDPEAEGCVLRAFASECGRSARCSPLGLGRLLGSCPAASPLL